MKYLFTYFIFCFILISCSNPKDYDKISSVKDFKKWEINVERSIVDTLNIGNRIPKSEISLKFINKLDSTCSSPSLDFYPIDLEDYIEKKLIIFLKLRSTLTPLIPKTYRNDKYFIIGWNFSEQNNCKPLDYSELEKSLMEKLNLKKIN